MTFEIGDERLEALLGALHRKSLSEFGDIAQYFRRREVGATASLTSFDADMHQFFSDKMVALDQEKGQLCYLLCRALGANRVVEAGTSFGVSTLYLAAAVRDNGRAGGVVIGTEYEHNKVEAARANFEAAGLAEFIDLREGDLRETLRSVEGPIDFMLADIWDVALPALELVSPALRQGAIVVCDATADHPEHYRDYFAFIHDPKNRFRTMTLPFSGGFELTVRI